MKNKFRYVIRASRVSDIEAIERLADLLDTMNLPRDRPMLKKILEGSEHSFKGQATDPADEEYIFVLEDRESGKPIGTSLIIAKHGTLGSPHFFMEIQTEERHSDVPPRDYRHRVLKLGHTTDGPTEVGGLVLHPDYRRATEQLGMQLSYVRFNFIARHPERFQKEVLAELLSPLDEKGKNLFWEVYGRKFTGLDYREADRLSITNKSFILSLFPQTPLYAALFPDEVQRSLGEVAASARAAKHLLTKIGFRFLNQIDPFDGGPFFGAAMRDVSIIRDSVVRCAGPEAPPEGEGSLAIVSHEGDEGFRAACAPVRIEQDEVLVGPDVRTAIGAEEGTPLVITPIP